MSTATAEIPIDPAAFTRLFDGLAAIGRDPRGGWTRLAWTAEEAEARAWFTAEAERLGLDVRTDRNANLWAWWGAPDTGAVVTGSHLDTVVRGGAYDGALGVVSGLAALDGLRRAGVEPARPIAVVAFTDEEGGRFNTPCLGSRLLTGALDPARLRDRQDIDGTTFAKAVASAGYDPDGLGHDQASLACIGVFVEVHIEQGRALGELDRPVGLAEDIWPHGRWRADVTGETNHAGTTLMGDRHDAMLVAAEAVVEARRLAEEGSGFATVGRVEVAPNIANAVPGHVRAWLDARTRDDEALDHLVEAWTRVVTEGAGRHGCDATVTEESRTALVRFDAALNDRLAAVLDPEASVPRLGTGAGHDAGILAAHVPATMLYVRNPTGASHTPSEFATPEDCTAGVMALAAVLGHLAGS